MSIFKAYDVRGLYPGEVNEAIAFRIGCAFAKHLGAKTIVVGRDMRPSSAPLETALCRGLQQAGASITTIGMCTTPMLYFAVGTLKASGGIMVTASHNPAQYNGLKFCREQAIPVGSASGLAEVEKMVRSMERVDQPAHAPATVSRDIVADYAAMLRAVAGEIAPMKVAIDCGNGVVGPFVSRCLGQFRAAKPRADGRAEDRQALDVVPLFFEPDGTFPNHEANPLKLENLRDLIAAVGRERCALGIAFDGDGDRAAFVDEGGKPVSGDMVTALIARAILARTKVPAGGAKPTVVYDLRSSRVVREEVEKAGGSAIEERVGHAFIKATMRKHGALFAGEVSGHFYFRENFNCESAMLAAIRILELVSTTGKPLSALVAEVDRYPRTGELNFHIEDKDGAIERLESMLKDARIYHLDGVTIRYPTWWCNVRKSNTEPLLRLNLEADDAPTLERSKARVIEAIGGTLEH